MTRSSTLWHLHRSLAAWIIVATLRMASRYLVHFAECKKTIVSANLSAVIKLFCHPVYQSASRTRNLGPGIASSDIATGLAVVGDLIGEGSAQEQSVVGETPNVAARLQAMAEDAVVVSVNQRRVGVRT
jgi:hypothetical protein